MAGVKAYSVLLVWMNQDPAVVTGDVGSVPGVGQRITKHNPGHRWEYQNGDWVLGSQPAIFTAAENGILDKVSVGIEA